MRGRGLAGRRENNLRAASCPRTNALKKKKTAGLMTSEVMNTDLKHQDNNSVSVCIYAYI